MGKTLRVSATRAVRVAALCLAGGLTLAGGVWAQSPGGAAMGASSGGAVRGTGLALPPVHRLVREFVLDVRPAQNLLVVKTITGSAQPVAAALDEQEWDEVVGTIAGDDAILIVCPDKDAAKKVAVRIEEMLG